jgi:hypothetical protein
VVVESKRGQAFTSKRTAITQTRQTHMGVMSYAEKDEIS